MRRFVTFAAFLELVVLGTIAAAADKAPESLVKTMKGINGTMTDVRTNLQGKDFAAITKSAASLQSMFKSTTPLWKQRKANVALTQSEAAMKAADEMLSAAKAKDEDGVLAAQKKLTASCNACHTAHREKMPDGTYGLK